MFQCHYLDKRCYVCGNSDVALLFLNHRYLLVNIWSLFDLWICPRVLSMDETKKVNTYVMVYIKARDLKCLAMHNQPEIWMKISPMGVASAARLTQTGF